MQIGFIDGAINSFITGPALKSQLRAKSSADWHFRRNGCEAQALPAANLRGIER
ncbi:hypothetical protein SAMN05446635_6122 [Burkholderia sp. OK233]|nr:hypothetical protein SAMN05446635_6122 [Burkholderia sp. OK233]